MAADVAEVAAALRRLTLPQIGAKAKAHLARLGDALGVPTDAVALAVRRPARDKISHEAWLWATYDAARVAALRKMPGHRWNATTKSNAFTLSVGGEAAFFTEVGILFHRILVIDGDSHRLVEGTGTATWIEPPAYELLPQAYPIRIARLLESVRRRRASDHVARVAVLDGDFRPLDADNAPDAPPAFRTRHALALFRLSVEGGKPRYALYDVAAGDIADLVFVDSIEARRYIARIKDAQARLNHPFAEAGGASA